MEVDDHDNDRWFPVYKYEEGDRKELSSREDVKKLADFFGSDTLPERETWWWGARAVGEPVVGRALSRARQAPATGRASQLSLRGVRD